ncbi:MAG: alpha-L-arabinofuranosidase C-terminal domain-containing protein [Pseudomonadales bacterium]
MVRELAWQSVEPNQFGTDEFIQLCRKLDWTPMLAVNLGTGTPEEARNWVEYCNAQAGTKFADMRVENGSVTPHAVPLWCLGNEMDGPWQLGHVPAGEYAISAQQAAKMMKGCDRTIQTVACGSSGPQMPTFGDWDRTILEEMGAGLADYISLHRYVGNPDGNLTDYLALSNAIDQQIETIDACARYVQGKRRSSRRSYLCFDEWNVWYRARGGSHSDGQGQFAPHLIEERYNFEDALVVAMFLMSFVRHADAVKIANLAQLVNVIGPIQTRGNQLLKQSIYYAFQMISARKGGIALRHSITSNGYESGVYGYVNDLDSASIIEGNLLKVFALNRDPVEPMELKISVADQSIDRVVTSDILHAESTDASNDFDDPEVVVSRRYEGWVIQNDATTQIPPLGLTATTFELA